MGEENGAEAEGCCPCGKPTSPVFYCFASYPKQTSGDRNAVRCDKTSANCFLAPRVPCFPSNDCTDCLMRLPKLCTRLSFRGSRPFFLFHAITRNAKLVHHNTPSCLLNPNVAENIKRFSDGNGFVRSACRAIFWHTENPQRPQIITVSADGSFL